MGIFDKYGPNTKQVKRFIERVGALTPKERESTEFEERVARSAFGHSNSYYVQVASESTYGRDHVEKMLAAAGKELRKATGDGDSGFYLRANEALMGLALCHEVMDDDEFATWYGSFARVIPMESLGEGLAPNIKAAPLFPPERLITRVIRAQGSWGGIESAHMMLMSAGGDPQRHEVAIEAALTALDKPTESPLKQEYRASLERSLEGINKLGTGPAFKRTEEAFDMIGSALQRAGVTEPIDWAIRTANRQFSKADFIDRFRHCCMDAALALTTFNEIADEHSYYLYTPFEAVIPIDSVLLP